MIDSGRFEPASVAHRPVATTRANRRLVRSRGLRDRDARCARHGRHERLRAVQQPRLRRRQHGERRRRDHRSRASRTAAPIRRIASRRSRSIRRSTSTAATTPWTRQSRLRLTANVATATPPTATALRARRRRPLRSDMGVQKYGRTTGFQLGAVRDVNFSVDVCYFALGEFCSRLRSAFRRPDLRLGRVVQRAGRFRLSDRHAGWEPAGRASLCRRWRADDREPDRPGAAALRRHDRRRAARDGPPARSHRPLAPRRRRQREPLLERAGLRRRLARSRTTRCIAARAPGR